jgi:hypothetical protein
MKMEWIIGLLIFFAGGTGGWIVDAHYKAKTIEQRQNTIDDLYFRIDSLNEANTYKLDSLLTLPAKIDTVEVHIETVRYKTDTIIQMNKSVMNKLDSVHQDTRAIRERIDNNNKEI